MVWTTLHIEPQIDSICIHCVHNAMHMCRHEPETSFMGCGPQTCSCKEWKQTLTGVYSVPMKLQGLQTAGAMSMLPCMRNTSGRGGQSAVSRHSSFGLPSLKLR